MTTTTTLRRSAYSVGAVFLFLRAWGDEYRPALRWAADAESGVPHVFYDENNHLNGFEYEIVEQIADRMGRKLEFYSCDWEMLLPGLKRGQYDLVLNGMEAGVWRQRAQKADVALSIPYYVTEVQLVVRRDDDTIRSLADCSSRRIGILKQSWHVEKLLSTLSGVEKRVYDDEVKAYADLKYGRTNVVVLDRPEVQYYTALDDSFRCIQTPTTRVKYSAIVRADDRDLRGAIDRAILAIQRDGTLKAILQRWNLWNEEMEFYSNEETEVDEAPTTYHNFIHAEHTGFYLRCIPTMMRAAWMTLRLSVGGMGLAIAMGLCLALLRTYVPHPFRWPVTIYVELVRGTPLLIQLLFVFYGLPSLSKYLPDRCASLICFSPFVAGVLSLGINYSAYEAENYRAGLASVSASQTEAARALGMTHAQALWHVILPQALRNVIPPVTNDFINLLQDSSLVSMITIVELTKSYQYLAASHFDYFGTGIVVALMYLALGFPFVRFSRWLEKRLSVGFAHKKASL
jgi:polar amino acid transport system substrate-binding protein